MNETALEKLVEIVPTFNNLKILGVNECNVTDEILINLCYNLEVWLMFKVFCIYSPCQKRNRTNYKYSTSMTT